MPHAPDRRPDFCGALGLGRTGVITLVGAGGKTSLLFRLARETVDGGGSALTTTTTRIETPAPHQCPHVVVAADYVDLKVRLSEALLRHRHVTAAAEQGAAGKLIGLSPMTVDRLDRERVFDRVLVEADGAARRPLKAPAAHEPVIPASSCRVVVVAGLSGLGQPLAEERVFRSQRFAALAGLTPGAIVSPAALAALVSHPEGGLKAVPDGCPVSVYLNQSDDPARSAAAREVCERLAACAAVDRVVIGRLQPAAEIHHVRAAAMGPPKDVVAGIILAAGCATRFGRPKQLLELGGRPMLQRVTDAALGSSLDRVVLVLGHAHSEVLQALDGPTRSDPRLRVLVTPDYRLGQSASLRAGVSDAAATCRAVLFLLGDQPLVEAADIDRILAEHRRADRPITVAAHQGRRGHPVVFSCERFPDLLQVRGDQGARELIASRPAEVHEVEVDSASLFMDVDTPGDAARVLEELKGQGSV